MNKQGQEKLDALTNAIEKMLNREVAPIAPIAPVAPVAPVLPIVNVNSGDHDTIVKLVEAVTNLDSKFTEKFNDLKNDIKNLADGTSTKIVDHENRIRRLEVWGFTAIGVLAALQFYFSFIRVR